MKLGGDVGHEPVDDAMHRVPTVDAASPSGRAEGTMKRALIAKITIGATAEFAFLKFFQFENGCLLPN